MSCPTCTANDGCACEEREIDVLYISPEQFRGKPQVGTRCKMEWDSFAAYLSRPSVGNAKDVAGGYSPALYVDNIRRKAGVRCVWALVVDVDECGDVDRVADAVAGYRAIVHETFSSTNDAPRCRLLLRLAEPIDAATYDRLHPVVRGHLRAAGIIADEGAKDPSRLSFSPVRRPDAGYRFRTTKGRPLDAARVLAAQPPKVTPRPVVSAPKHADAYVGAALRRAADAVASATPGDRHYALCREAFTLGRLELRDDEIEGALLPAAVASMGEARKREAERAIRDALRARRGATP